MLTAPAAAVASTDSSIEPVLLSDTESELVFSITLPDKELKRFLENGSLDGPWGYYMEPGQPLVPCIGRLVAVPEGKVAVLGVAFLDERYYRNVTIQPSDAGGSFSIGSGPVSASSGDRDRYFGAEGFLPVDENRFEVSNFSAAGRNFARLSIFPVQYNPSSETARAAHRFKVTVSFKNAARKAGPSTGASRLLSPRHSRNREPSVPMLLRSAINGSSASEWRAGAMENEPPSGFGNNILTGGMPLSGASPPAGSGHLPDFDKACRIVVDEDSLYVFYGRDLEKADIDISRIDPRKLGLYLEGEPVPIYVEGKDDGDLDPGDRMIFYGKANRGDFTHYDYFSNLSTYFLEWGVDKPLHFIEEDGALAERDSLNLIFPDSYTMEVHAEQDLLFSHLEQNASEEIEHWFWRSVEAPSYSNVQFTLPAPDTTRNSIAETRVRLMGKTFPDENPDHHIQIFLQGQLIHDAWWDGQTPYIYDGFGTGSGVPNTRLKHGYNGLMMVLPGDTEAGSIDEVFLDWIEVRYARSYRVLDNMILFEKPLDGEFGLHQFEIAGLLPEGDGPPDIELFKLGVSRIANWELRFDESDDSYSLLFQDHIYTEGTSYFACTDEMLAEPLTIERCDHHEDLYDPVSSAELLILAPEDFYEPVQVYAAWKEEQGVSTRVFHLQDIYDHFSYGKYSPVGIKEFLAYAFENWPYPSPRYVLLVGEETWSHRYWARQPETAMPSIEQYTYDFGATTSDHWFSTIADTSNIPAIAVGRWTVRNTTDLQHVMNKLMDGSDDPDSTGWSRNIIILGGEQDYFREKSEELVSLCLPEYWVPRKVFVVEDNSLDPDPFFGNTNDLIDYMDSGASVINFQGHGGGAVWSDQSLLDLTDVPMLDNRFKLPVIFSITCLTSSFASATRTCLGEAFLREKHVGAKAFFGSTALSYKVNGVIFNRYFLRLLGEPGAERIGDLIVRAETEFYIDNAGLIADDLLNAYLLIGDPTELILMPNPGMSVDVTPLSVGAGEEVSVSAVLEGAGVGGVGCLSFVDPLGCVIDERMGSLDSGVIQATFTISEDSRSGLWTVRAAAIDGNGYEGVGAGGFAVDSPFFSGTWHEPEFPSENDEVEIFLDDEFNPPGEESYSCEWAFNYSFYNPEFTAMAYHQDGYWKTETPLPPSMPLSSVFYRIVHIDDDTTRGGIGSWTVEEKPDFSLVFPYDMHLGVTGETLVLRFAVSNGSGRHIENIPVSFKYRRAESGGRKKVGDWLPFEPLDRDTLDLGPLETAYAEIPFTLPKGEYSVVAFIDPDSTFDETSEYNNFNSGRPVHLVYDHFLVTPGNGTGGFVSSPDGNFSCEAPPGYVSSPTTVTILSGPIPEPVEQPDIGDVIPEFGDEARSWVVSLIDSSVVTGTGDLRVEIRYADDDSLNPGQEMIAPYKWCAPMRKWLRQEADPPDSGVVRFTTHDSGLFTLFESDDETGPHIELNVEGQHYTRGCFVSRTPSITALIQDENGVDTSAASIVLELDGEAVDQQELAIRWSNESPNWMTVTWMPTFERGARHTVGLTADDVNLNIGFGEIEFVVSNDLDIIRYGNYPNPVKGDRTTFVFYLTDWADDVILGIYTASGRLIRQYSHASGDPDLRPVDYSEKTWDMVDEQGYPVANGIYFYKIKAVAGSEEAVVTGKMAVLR